MPEDHEQGFPGMFEQMRLFVSDLYDYILSKLERNSSKDRDDADYLFRTQKLDSQTLRERYQQELRPYLAKENWHDKTLELWIGSLRPLRSSQTPAT